MRVLLTLLALLTGLASPAAHAGVLHDAGAGVEQVEPGDAPIGVVAASVALGNLTAAKRAARETEPRPLPQAPPVIVAAVERGDRALE